jgi:hypothetical protein
LNSSCFHLSLQLKQVVSKIPKLCVEDSCPQGLPQHIDALGGGSGEEVSSLEYEASIAEMKAAQEAFGRRQEAFERRFEAFDRRQQALETEFYAFQATKASSDTMAAAEYPGFTRAQVEATKALFLNTACGEGAGWMEAALGDLFGDDFVPLTRRGLTKFKLSPKARDVVCNTSLLKGDGDGVDLGIILKITEGEKHKTYRMRIYVEVAWSTKTDQEITEINNFYRPLAKKFALSFLDSKGGVRVPKAIYPSPFGQ